MKVKFLKTFRKKYTYTFENNEYIRSYIYIFRSDFSKNWCIDTLFEKKWVYNFVYNNRSDFSTFFIFTLIMFDLKRSKREKKIQDYLHKRKNKKLYEGIKNGTIKTID